MYSGLNIKLKDLFIGFADGEREAQEVNFMDMFYKDNNKYSELMNNDHKFLITGSKGAGKTILAKYIEKDAINNGDLSKIIKMNDINLQRLIELGYKKMEDYELNIFCRWIILSEISRSIMNNKLKISSLKNGNKLKNFIGYIKFRKHLKKLSTFFKIRYPDGNYANNSYTTKETYNVGSEFEQKIADFHNFKTSCNVEGSIGTQHNKKNYYDVLDEIEKLVYACLEMRRVILIFDDLDEFKNIPGEGDFYFKFIIDLIDALKRFNSDLISRKIDGSRAILLIRSDILDELNKKSSNLNKLITDSQVKLYWIDKNTSSPELHPLMDLILSKIQKSNPALQNLAKGHIYSKLFPEKIEKKTAIDYLLDNSFGRPRDLVTYLNIIINNNKDENYFGAKMFRDARVEYSTSFWRELYNELNIHKDLEYIEECFSLLCGFGKQIFSYSEIEEYFKTNKKKYSSIKKVDECLQFLYKFGVIGNSWERGSSSKKSKNKYKFSWAYREDGLPTPDFDKMFVVHYGLRKKFSM